MATKERIRKPQRPAQKPKQSGPQTVKSARTPIKRRPVRRSSRPVGKVAPKPEVVYTQPGPFNRNRFLLHLATVLAVVLALVFGMSIFFKVKTVTVSGAEKYTPWQVREASGIQEGENLLGVSQARLSSLIRSKLPYVERVRIGIKLPDTVNIEIKELDVVYAVEAQDGTWWLMRSDGRLVEKTNAADAGSSTKLLGVQLTAPAVGEQATAYEQPPEQTLAEGVAVPVSVSAAERLSTAVSVIGYLEENGMIGTVASVDVSDMGSIELWYGERYQILLGDTTRLSYKISSARTAIDQMGDYQTGVLDASFTVEIDGEANKVIYTPFN